MSRPLAVSTFIFVAFLYSTGIVLAQHAGHGTGGHGSGHSGHASGGHSGDGGAHAGDGGHHDGGHDTASHVGHADGHDLHDGHTDAHHLPRFSASLLGLGHHRTVGTITDHHDFSAHTLQGSLLAPTGSIGLSSGFRRYSSASFGSYGAYGYVPGEPLVWAGGLRLKVQPAKAEVFVDGYYVGSVDDFDGLWQRLKVESGLHHIEIRAAGYAALEFDIEIEWDRTITYRGALAPLP